MSDVKVVCEIGQPGKSSSAIFSPLDLCDKVDVGIIIRDEIPDDPYSWLPSLPTGYYVVHNGVPVVKDGMYVIFERRIIDE